MSALMSSTTIPLIKQQLVHNIVFDFPHWLQDQKIRTYNRGIYGKKMRVLERDVEHELPKDYKEIVGEIGIILNYSMVDLYRESQMVNYNEASRRERPEHLIEFASYAKGGVFCFDFLHLRQKLPTMVLYSYEKSAVLWDLRNSFKAWYQLMHVYDLVEKKDYLKQDGLEEWEEDAKKQMRQVYHALQIHPFNEEKQLMLL
jgi:hypothetical protein